MARVKVRGYDYCWVEQIRLWYKSGHLHFFFHFFFHVFQVFLPRAFPSCQWVRHARGVTHQGLLWGCSQRPLELVLPRCISALGWSQGCGWT